MSGGAIFMIDGESRLVEMREQPYDDELVLQKLLAVIRTCSRATRWAMGRGDGGCWCRARCR